MTIQGLDVSNWQGPAIDWGAVAASGISFAIVKAGEMFTQDVDFAVNWAGLAATGLARGAYYFARPDSTTPESAAAAFVTWLINAGLVAGDVVALDLEAGTGDLSAWTIAFLAEVEARLGCKPLLYSDSGFLTAHNCAGNATLEQYGLWIASWSTTPPASPTDGWPFYACWQRSSSGSVPGIAGAVDMDTFNGTVEQFRLYGVPATPVPTPTPQQATPTNDDIVAMERLLLAKPNGVPDLVAYAQQQGFLS